MLDTRTLMTYPWKKVTLAGFLQQDEENAFHFQENILKDESDILCPTKSLTLQSTNRVKKALTVIYHMSFYKKGSQATLCNQTREDHAGMHCMRAQDLTLSQEDKNLKYTLTS